MGWPKEDLPKLPLEIGRLVVDEQGFHRGDLNIRWDSVAEVFLDGSTLHVHALAPGGKSGAALHQRCSFEEAEAASEHWREELLQRTERDGVLRGTIIYTRSRWTPHVLIALSPVMAAIGVWGSLGAYGSSLPNIAERPWLPLFWCGLAAVLLAVFGVVFLLREIRLARDWSKWELTRDGLVHFPGGERRLLRFQPGDAVTQRGSVIGGERLRVDRLSGATVVQPLVHAMADRKNVEIATRDDKKRVLIADGRAMLERLGW